MVEIEDASVPVQALTRRCSALISTNTPTPAVLLPYAMASGLAASYKEVKSQFSSKKPDLQKCGTLLSKLKVCFLQRDACPLELTH